MIPKPTIKILLSLFFLAIINKGVNAQITLLQDYKNNYSAPIGTFQNIKFREGGFSGMYPIPNTNGKEFWVISDRGVNVDAANANPSTCRPTYDKIYGFPNYAPKIHRIKLVGDSIQILKTITMKRPGGTNASGLLNPTGYGSTAAEVVSTDTVLNCTNFNIKTAAKDIWGIDAEGIVVDRDGNFWICEEGGPTIWKLDPNGIVLKRFTPYANKSGAQSIDVYIDSCFGYRKNNRGFEGLSITPNGKIYAMIQSPLLYPSTTIGESTRVHRLLEIDPSNNATRMMIYLNDGPIGASGSNQIRFRDWKIGDMSAINDSTFLIIEHAVRGTTDRKNIYSININNATAVNSGLYSGKTIEALIDSSGLAANAIKPVKKKLFMDLLANGWPTVLDKPEGLAIINDSTIAVCNDNDFQQISVPQDGIATATTNLSHVLSYQLKGSNKLSGYKMFNSNLVSKIDYSFVVLGCNRVDDVDTAGNPSTANVYQLNRMFKEVSLLNPLPKYLFFAGDMVLGYEADTVKLAKQLTNWLSLYQASPLYGTSVQLVAIQGNHETQNKAAGKKSFVAAERTYLRIMKNYILGSNGPTITGLAAGTDSLTTDQSKLTYSFDFKDDHFVIVNTDPVGRDGKASYKWISNDIKNARLKGARHIFGIGHKPAYTGHFKATPDGLENNLVQRDSFWNAMEKYQADAFFSAHIHASDSIQPHTGKTWQIIAGNGGSLVEPLFATSPNAYFGYVIVNVFANDSVNVQNMGRDANMTAGNYFKAAPENPTTVRGSYNININPVINHIPMLNTLNNGPFTVTATINDNVAVVNSQLNYSVNGITKTAIAPVINGNTYTFTIPVQPDFGVIKYNIQANDASLIKIYSTGTATRFNLFSFGPISQTGPSTTQIPYVEPGAPGVKTTSILSAGDSISGYKMAGIPDGLGAFDNGNGTFTLLANHEIPNTFGVARAHGSKGAFVSKWVINKSDLKVISGTDLMKNVNLWDTATKAYKLYNSSNPSSLSAFTRFCAADLPLVSAFYNSVTGLGTQERLFMNGEEGGDESRAFAHIATGTNAGTSYELPALGKAAWENAVASPATGDKTVVGLMNDGTDGQVYFYIGTKTNTGTEIEKAGLTKGKPWGVSVSGFAAERTSSTSNIALPSAGTRFSLIDLGSVENKTGAVFNTLSNTLGVTKFSRPEDGAWDPSNSRDFYFNTTDQIDQVKDGLGTQIGRSRVWRLRFDDITKPELGGTIEAVLDGTEGQVMLDNMVIDKYGHILLQEDVGNSAHNGKVWQYTIATDQIKIIAKHDVSKFGDVGIAATAPFSADEESSGIIDMEDILGAGMFLTSDQAHYSLTTELYEGGQFLSFFNPETYVKANGAGPSSSNTPYLEPIASGVKTTSLLTVGDVAGNYALCGLPDGLGAYDNNNGTFTVLMNHEIGNTLGAVRAHGSKGAFVSKWVINKSDLKVLSGSDLMKNVNLWNGTNYVTYNSANPSTSAAFTRFCSADLPPVSAFFNSASGLGTQERIFMNGEEAGTEGRAFGHISTGPNAGNTYELPYLGKFSWENAVASPFTSNKTIVAGTDDATPGQVYFYIGSKTNSGTEIEKAGLTGGKLFGVKVSGLTTEVSTGIPTAGTVFTMVDLGQVHNTTGVALNAASDAAGVTTFLRPEDGAWDPSNPNDFYFVTTNAFTSPSRLWKLHFTDPANPENGGTITALLDGSEGQKMLDNIGFDKFGHILMQEDVGNQTHNGKMWQYTIATDGLKLIAQHDPSRFISGGANFLTQDEEASGIIDMQDILGVGNFLYVDQAHYSLPGELVEGGQLLTLYNPDTYNSNPEISVKGNKIAIPAGNTAISVTDNTDFGTLNTGTSVNKTFVVKNAGPGALIVKGISLNGANAADYSIVGAPVFPSTISVNDSLIITVKFTPLADGIRKATLAISNNDNDEGNYNFALQGTAVTPEINLQGNGANIFNNDVTPGIANSTDFGLVVKGSTMSKSFTIQNTGLGILTVSGINITGTNANEFTVLGSPTFPMSIAASSNQTFNVQFAPVSGGLKTANIVIASNDIDESTYTFAIQGNGNTSGVNKVISENAITIAPNPFETNSILKLVLPTGSKVSVEVFNSLGQSIEMLVNAELVAGEYNFSIGENQMLYSTGMYLVRTVINDKVTVTKMIKTN